MIDQYSDRFKGYNNKDKSKRAGALSSLEMMPGY